MGYVWDFQADLSPSWPLRRGLRHLGADVPGAPGNQDTSIGALTSLFELAGSAGIVATSFDVTMHFVSFDDFWAAQTPNYSPIGKLIGALTHSDREQLVEDVRTQLQVGQDGRFHYSARANAIRSDVRSA